MQPHRLAVKLFSVDPERPIELGPFIGLFHRFIQDGSVEGLLLDVADYAHVPDGPGIMLIGHEVEYAIDRTGGRTGLLTVRKRAAGTPLAGTLRDAFRKALVAAAAITRDGSTELRLDTASAAVHVLDRLAAPNDAATYEALAKEIEPLARELFGPCELSREHADDPRQAVAVRIRAEAASDLDTLLGRLGGADGTEIGTATPEKQSDWDIEPEDLQRLRESGRPFVLIDVREPDEYAVCNLGGELIPLKSLAGRIGELDPEAHTVVHCKVGGRGAQAVRALREAGFEDAWHLRGGILAWIDRIDPSLTRY